MDFTSIQGLLKAYRKGEITPAEYLGRQWQKAKADQNNCWISHISEARLDGYIKALAGVKPESKPLYGVPFAIKDNIDLAGLPTTAACEAFAYIPGRSAFAVQALIEAGAVPLGKTNLDQFATGLNGTRSPYGACKNSIDPEYVSGGSSSGSAVSVALNQVLFSLGTDTAGSGRIPAAFNQLVGMKASIGRISCRGVVPACRTLDCVTLFANTVEDIEYLLPIAGQYDACDAYARDFSETGKGTISRGEKPVIGVPEPENLEFFGNAGFAERFERSKAHLASLGAELVDIDIQDFLDAATLLYQGPWVAERYAAIEDFFNAHAGQCEPAIQTILGTAEKFSAVDAFNAQYRLQVLKKRCDATLDKVDAVLTPTAGTIYTIEEVLQEPLQRNTDLGYYTNFMNLLDYAAIAIPADNKQQGMPFGITLFADKGTEPKLMALAKAYTANTSLAAEAKRTVESPLSVDTKNDTMLIAVCGAHMEGLPLNVQLKERNALFVAERKSAPAYRFFALSGDGPKRPGMVRVNQDGVSIELELWQLPTARVGDFLSGIPSPLGLGKVELEDGTWVTGFTCEASGIANATDISEYGGWRNYLAS